MFSTSLVVAVTGLMAVGSGSTQPVWQTSYRAALAQAAQQHKPVAAFIGRGEAGYVQVVRDGVIGSEAAATLATRYIALYIDTASDAGSELAHSFGMSRGLVISDRTGGVQALRHEGAVSESELTSYLVRFDAMATVATTETHPTAAPAIVHVAGYTPAVEAAPVVTSAPVIGTYVPTAAPVVSYSPGLSAYSPAPVTTFAPTFARPSCPNGRCPYAR